MEPITDRGIDAWLDEELLEQYRQLTEDLAIETDQVPEVPLLARIEEEIQRRGLPLPDEKPAESERRDSRD